MFQTISFPKIWIVCFLLLTVADFQCLDFIKQCANCNGFTCLQCNPTYQLNANGMLCTACNIGNCTLSSSDNVYQSCIACRLDLSCERQIIRNMVESMQTLILVQNRKKWELPRWNFLFLRNLCILGETKW